MEKGPKTHEIDQENAVLHTKSVCKVSFKKRERGVSPRLNVLDILVY